MNPNDIDQTLRAAARDLVPPPFSESLHARLMADVARDQATPAVHPRRVPWLLALATLATAAVVALVLLPHRPTTTPAPTPRLQLAALEPLADLLDGALPPVPTKLRETRFAYLDRDAARLAHFLLDQIPTLPSAPAAEPHHPDSRS